MSKKHKKTLLSMVEFAATKIIENTSNVDIAVPKETDYLIKSKTPVIFISLHKSMWETIGLHYSLLKTGGETAYTFMGSNLIKGKFFVNLVKDLKIIPIERDGGISAANKMINDVEKILEEDSLLVFPQPGRSKEHFKEFKTTIFGAANILSKNNPVYLVPVNVDYSIIREEEELTNSKGIYTFKIQDSFKWFKNLGNIYVSFGNPIIVDNGELVVGSKIINYNSKQLTEHVKNSCLDLVKILPVNVVSTAISKSGSIYYNIELIVDELAKRGHSGKFRDFGTNDSPESIYHSSHVKNTTSKKIAKLYSTNIEHYLK